jgi:glucose-1-phosphate cytidylyltransferase
MKCVILAGGKGTRLAEETSIRPKPMVSIGDRPILWHIMKIYAAHGVNDFIICLGHLGYSIKEYFSNYYLHNADVTFDIGSNTIQYHEHRNEPWKVTLVDTGQETMTGGRLRRIRRYLDDGEPFCMTYGDGVANVNISATIDFHRAQGRKATVTCVRPQARFGHVIIDGGRAIEFEEKPLSEGGHVNGGFFVLQTSALDYCTAEDTIWEREPLRRLAEEGELSAWMHDGFWQPMDTLRDRMTLEELWTSGKAHWKVW